MRSVIEKITAGKSAGVYARLLESVSSYACPHEFIQQAYGVYVAEFPDNPSINGRVFEYLVCETLAREGITPFYYQAKFAHVPNANFDVACYDPERPVVLSMKVSLRERYKQAVLEGFVLQQVYRNAECYLITLSGEAVGVSRKIADGEVAGLSGCAIADKPEYSALLGELKERQFCAATSIMPITGRALLASSA